jgi:putative endonuclease
VIYSGVAQRYLPAGRQGAIKNMYTVYAIKSRLDNRIYVGLSQNHMQRLSEHNAGRVKSTKHYRPWQLLFIETGHQSLPSARLREKKLKSGFGKEFLKSLPKNKITYSGVAQR